MLIYPDSTTTTLVTWHVLRLIRHTIEMIDALNYGTHADDLPWDQGVHDEFIIELTQVNLR